MLSRWQSRHQRHIPSGRFYRQKREVPYPRRPRFQRLLGYKKLGFPRLRRGTSLPMYPEVSIQPPTHHSITVAQTPHSPPHMNSPSSSPVFPATSNQSQNHPPPHCSIYMSTPLPPSSPKPLSNSPESRTTQTRPTSIPLRLLCLQWPLQPMEILFS